MDANNKRYLKEFLGSMAGYSLMVPLSIWLLRGHEHRPLGYWTPRVAGHWPASVPLSRPGTDPARPGHTPA